MSTVREAYRSPTLGFFGQDAPSGPGVYAVGAGSYGSATSACRINVAADGVIVDIAEVPSTSFSAGGVHWTLAGPVGLVSQAVPFDTVAGSDGIQIISETLPGTSLTILEDGLYTISASATNGFGSAYDTNVRVNGIDVASAASPGPSGDRQCFTIRSLSAGDVIQLFAGANTFYDRLAIWVRRIR